jgi:hypothetical protein
MELVKVLVRFGLTERQAGFLPIVMLHSGVFVGRQYAAFAGITHGQKVHDFIEKQLVLRLVTPIELGSTGRTRLFHVHHKPLYAAIGEPDNRNRRRVTIDRAIERLMILAGVLGDQAAHAEGPSGAGPTDRQTGEREAGDSHPSAPVLLSSGDAWRAGKGDPGARGTSGHRHDAAVHAPESCGARCGDSVVGDRDRNEPRGRGEIVEAAGTEGPKAHIH